ncbi:twin-arginine translocase subunit TatC [Jatrophihabitans sp.]|uniref:twin-arginine translocase subunit TatC n=1 Tax=Jatrophihabitans sp. TaxID=1932789 RepID=UPI0030C6C83F|nr:Sec-independent protein translocase protein TatC [Jatrophihabitans sp.]
MAKVARKVRAKRHNPEGQMSVLDHLRELRRRLIWALLFVALGAVLGWEFYPHILSFLKKPYCNVPVKYRFVSATNPKSCDLIYHGVLDGFTSRLKISVITGAVITGPLWLYQIWAFITPGLRKNERRYTIGFIISSTLLFAAGMSLAFLVLYKGIRVVLEISGSGTQAFLTINDYISFVTLMLVVFGAAFELPLIVVMANLAGVLSGAVLKKSQRIGIFLIFLFAAVATPTTDPFTMCAMAIPMVVLFEAAVLFAVIHDKRKARRIAAEHGFEDLGDDVASPVEAVPTPLGSDDGGWGDTT